MHGSDVEIDGHRIAVSNLDRVLYPADGTRKFDIIEYYLQVADVLVRHAASRPVTRKRWPSGVNAAPFFEKDLPESAPGWIPRVTLTHAEHDNTYPVLTGAAELVWLAQLAALELHVPQWRVDLSPPDTQADASLRTDRLVLDLDPGTGVSLADCGRAALVIRDVLMDAGLTAFPVTSGSKGIHVYARLPGAVQAASARTVARQIAESLAQTHPEDFTASMARAERTGRVLVDWSQNSASKTTVTPYSLRGSELPWVAAPRTWAEIAEPGLRQLHYREVLARLTTDGDLLAELSPAVQSRADDRPFTAPEVIDLHSYRQRRTPGRAPGAQASGPHDTAPGAQASGPNAPAPGVTASEPHDTAPGAHEGQPEIPVTIADDDGATAKPQPTLPGDVPDRIPPEPGPVRPMLATAEPVAELDSERWAFEGKWDGYRVLVRYLNGRLRLTSRSGLDLTNDFPEFEVLTEVFDGHDLVLDGEIVAINAAGHTDFTLLGARRHTAGEVDVRLYIFDLLYLDGVSYAAAPWQERRRQVEALHDAIRGYRQLDIPDLIAGPGTAAIAESRRRGLEGIVAKDRRSPYESGRRSSRWLKHKNWSDIEVVVGGYRTGRGGSEKVISSLLVGLPVERGLRYLGRVGTGFTDAALDQLLDELEPLRIRICPFVDTLDAPVASSAMWVLPKIVADVRFMDWTSTGHLRHPSWRGIRRDKLPGDL